MPVVKGDRIGDSVKLSDASPDEQDAYARMVATLPDNFGRLRLSWTQIVAAMYPRMEDPRRIARAAARWKRFINGFERRGLLRTWEVDGITYAEISGWEPRKNPVYHRTPEPPWGGHEHTGWCLSTAITRLRDAGDRHGAATLSNRLKQLRQRKGSGDHSGEGAIRPSVSSVPSVPSGPYNGLTEPSLGSKTHAIEPAPEPARPPAESTGALDERTRELAKYGEPGEAEALRVEVGQLVAERQQATGQPFDVLLARASKTTNGRMITNLAGCGSVPWLRTTRDKLIEMRLRDAANDAEARAAPLSAKAQQRERVLKAAVAGGLKGDGTSRIVGGGRS